MGKEDLALLLVALGLVAGLVHLVPGRIRQSRLTKAHNAPGPQQDRDSGREQPMAGENIAICLEEGVGTEIYETTSRALQRAYEMKVVCGPVLSVPEETLDPRRGQYLADAVLTCVPLPEKAMFSLGIVRGDLYTPGLNFVFGMAQGRRALISIHRLQAGEPGHALFMRRVAVEAVHEIGHLLGLGHCSDPACVMFFSNTLADTDRKGTEPCPGCKAILRRRGRQ